MNSYDSKKKYRAIELVLELEISRKADLGRKRSQRAGGRAAWNCETAENMRAELNSILEKCSWIKDDPEYKMVHKIANMKTTSFWSMDQNGGGEWVVHGPCGGVHIDPEGFDPPLVEGEQYEVYWDIPNPDS